VRLWSRHKINPVHELVLKLMGQANSFIHTYEAYKSLAEKDNFQPVLKYMDADLTQLKEWIERCRKRIEDEAASGGR
jgi:hypothetical protein